MQVRRGQTRAFKVKKRASKACADAGDSDADDHKACADAGDQGADVCKPGGTRAIKVKMRAGKACADAVHQGADACRQGVSDAGDQGEDVASQACAGYGVICAAYC